MIAERSLAGETNRDQWLATAVAGLVYASCALLGGWLSNVPAKSDDVLYTAWGIENASNPLAWLGPSWGPHYRPLNSLVWWLSAQVGVDGSFARVAQVALWSALVALVVTAARCRSPWAAIGAAALLLLDQVFLDLLQWKSWLTTTGDLFGLAIALVELARPKPRWWLVALAGVLSLGFKEPGAFALGAMLLSRRERTPASIGAALMLAAAVCAHAATYKLGAEYVPTDTLEQLAGLGGLAWSLPVLVAAAFPGTPTWVQAASALAFLAPPELAGTAVAVFGLLALRERPSWLVGAAVAWAVPLFGSHHAFQYMLEGWLIVVIGIGLFRSVPTHPLVWACAFLAAVPISRDFATARAAEAEAADRQQAFLATFDPPDASVLCLPDPSRPLDVDVLVWMQRGARLDYQGCPADVAPVATGPLSGVWALP